MYHLLGRPVEGGTPALFNNLQTLTVSAILDEFGRKNVGEYYIVPGSLMHAHSVVCLETPQQLQGGGGC